MVDGGNSCINRASNTSSNYCHQLRGNPIGVSGTIISWCTYMYGAGTVDILIFRDQGTYYSYVGGMGVYCPIGFSSHSTSISVQVGDIVGYYAPGSTFETDTSGDSRYIYKNSGVKPSWNTQYADWSYSDAYKLSLGVTIEADYYIKTDGSDANTGLSWAQAWKTINKAATTVTDGKIVHIGFGTYNAEPSGNKIAPQNVGTSGIYYLPETATTGGGTGTVSVEQNV